MWGFGFVTGCGVGIIGMAVVGLALVNRRRL